MFKRYFIAAAALALLSACSTTDNLDASAGNAGDASRTTLPGDSHVAPVQADHAMQEVDCQENIIATVAPKPPIA